MVARSVIVYGPAENIYCLFPNNPDRECIYIQLRTKQKY